MMGPPYAEMLLGSASNPRLGPWICAHARAYCILDDPIMLTTSSLSSPSLLEVLVDYSTVQHSYDI